MKFIISLLILAFSLNTFAANKYISGEGRFWAEEDDSLIFIKEQLVHNAFVSVITKELERLGLDVEMFWLKHNENFTDKFEPIKEKLIIKYGLNNPEKEATTKQKEKFKKAIRKIKLNRKRKYSKFSKIIQSFAIKKMSRSMQHSQSRFLSLEAKINRIALNKIYYKLIREVKTKVFKNLFLSFEYNLHGATWSDLNVDNEKTFTSEVNSHWLKWIEKEKNANVESVHWLKDGEENELKKHLAFKYEDIDFNIKKEFKDSIALIAKIDIIKGSENKTFKEYNFSYSVGFVLIDLETNFVLKSFDSKKIKKVFRGVDELKLSSVVANYLYRLPLDSFKDSLNFVKDTLIANKIKILKLRQFKNIDEVLKFTKQLEVNGIKLGLKTKLERFSRERSDLVVFYQGDDTILSKFLMELKSKKDNLEIPFDFIDPAKPFEIVIKSVKEESGLEIGL